MSKETDETAAQIARLHEAIAPFERITLAKMETVIDQAIADAGPTEDRLPWSDPHRILGDIRRARDEWRQAEIDNYNAMAANYVLVVASPALTTDSPPKEW